MSPLDDELRAALHGRATGLRPSPDPLAGVERRATRIRRRRTVAAVAGSALAVAAVALAVPALTPSSGPEPQAPAATPSTVTTSPSPQAPSPQAFSFDDPWEFRGDRATLADGSLEPLTREWAALKGVAESSVDVVPLYGEVFESSRVAQVVYAARVRASQEMEYGLVLAREGGPEFTSRAPLSRETRLLLVPAPGDEVPRLFAVAAPDARRLDYAPDGATYREMAVKAPGVGLVGLEGDTSRDRVRLTHADGSSLEADAPEPSGADAPPVTGERPDNVLDWPFRGVADDALVARAAAAYAQAQQVPVDQVEYDVLLTAGTDGGLAYAVLQAWVRGERAQVFALVERPDGTSEPVLQPLTDPDVPVVAVLLTGVPGRTTDELVVLPQPQTGQVLYTPPGGQERPVEPAPGLDGVVLIDRQFGADRDRLRVLDGDGDLDAPVFDGLVFDLLCGETSCG
jgi:hypothetical protein